jgi:lambda family phage tail tape measure protein
MVEQGRKQDIQNTTNASEAQISRQQALGDLLVSDNDKMKDTQFAGAQQQRNPLEQQLANIQEEARKAALEAGRAFSAAFEGMDLTSAQSEELANGLQQIADKYKAIATEQTNQLTASRSWDQGWKTAFDNYMDNATNAAQRAGEVFGSITRNMESAIDNFVTTGKFSFKDFSRSIIQDLIKIELKAQATKLLGMMGGGGGIFSAIGSFLGFANGGTPPLNKPSIVGEQGPELFVPRSAGTVIPNDKLGGGNNQISAPVTNNYITNNISALDAKSVDQLFAENRKTLLGTVEMARKEMPYSNR